MKIVTILKGLPASGKSYWAKQQIEQYPRRYKRVSKDDLRAMLDNDKWSKENEKFILKSRNALILAALQEGYHVLVDDTNLHTKHEQAIRELVKGLATIEIKGFTDVPLETCIERDRKRPNYVGEQVIRRMYRDFLQPKIPVIEFDVFLPDAIISDIDGTLALLHGRNPYDASTCEQDSINEVVYSILGRYCADHAIFLVSGRGEQYRVQTVHWLEKYGIQYNALYMRPEGDSRKDALVKRELYERHIQGKYNVKLVLDDRNQMINLWRSLGLTALQVAEGDF